MSTHVKLHAKPGLTALHIGDDVHAVAADGTVTVPAHQVEDALSIGASHTPVAAPAEPAEPFDRLADLEARVVSLELAAGDFPKKRK